MRKMWVRVTVIGLIIAFILLTAINPVFAGDDLDGAHLFEVHCAGCHPNGGNIIRRGKNLRQKALKKFKMDSVESITSIVIQGKGIMSAFGKKLTPAEIQEVSQYVLQQAEKDWSK